MNIVFPFIPKRSGTTLGVGIIGLGVISPIHLRAFQTHRKASVVAIADSNPALLRIRAGEIPRVQSYDDYHKLLLDPAVDIVDILLPHYLHSKVVCEVMRAGKDVICEKPLATRPGDIDAIIKISRVFNKHVYVKQYFRFSRLHQKATEMILRGDIGKPYLVSATYTVNAMDSFTDPDSWRGNKKEAGGGVLMDVGVHMIDYLSEIFGAPVSVLGTMKKNFTPLPIKGEDFAVATIEFRNNITANIICTAVDSSYGFRWEKHYFGSDGSIHLIDNGKTNIELSLRKYGEVIFTETENDWWSHANVAALHDIVDRISRHEPPAVSLTEVKRTVLTIVKAYESSAVDKRMFLRN